MPVKCIEADLAPIKEPQRHRQSDGEKHVGTDRDDAVHRTGRDQLLPDLPFAAASIRRAVGHDEARAARGVEGAVETLDPEVIGVVAGSHPPGVVGTVILETRLVDALEVEGRVRHHEVEAILHILLDGELVE